LAWILFERGEVMIDEDVFEPYDEYDLRPNVGFWETLKTIYYDGEDFRY
jgi:hypothetical protein